MHVDTKIIGADIQVGFTNKTGHVRTKDLLYLYNYI